MLGRGQGLRCNGWRSARLARAGNSRNRRESGDANSEVHLEAPVAPFRARPRMVASSLSRARFRRLRRRPSDLRSFAQDQVASTRNQPR
jgi:hypothetical protein